MSLGFWGTFVVHRGEEHLWELLPQLAHLDGAELYREDRPRGWQVTRVFAMPHELPREFLEHLRGLTGAPVLSATVLDSDTAVVRAIGPRGRDWQTWLNREKAVEYVANGPGFHGDRAHRFEAARRHILAETDPRDCASRAVAWAAEAGWDPASEIEVAALLTSEELYVESLFFDLLEQLGLHLRQVEAPERPSFVDLLTAVTGRRLDAVHSIAHQPIRGERLPHPHMRDIRLQFDAYPSLTACGCGREFALLPTAQGAIVGNSSDVGTGEDVSGVLTRMLGRRLTAATTVRYRYAGGVQGLVLRFGDVDVFLAAVDGKWTIADGAHVPQPLADRDSPDHRDLVVNRWIESQPLSAEGERR